MTALKPIENRRVRAVASERYPLNDTCAHPECREKTDDPHHIFPRSMIAGDSWFVEIVIEEEVPELSGADWKVIYPHVTGICRSHHNDVEEHRAWIKLEDGEYVWYDRIAGGLGDEDATNEEWPKLGPLNPQPGSREGKPKRRKFAGEAKRKRANWQVRVPSDAEDGAGILDDGLEAAYKVVCQESDIEPDETTTSYVKLTYVLHWVNLHA